MKKPTRLEKSFSQRLARDLKEIPYSWWHKPQTKSIRGIPDWIGCIRGRFISLELKRVGARPDPSREKLQAYVCTCIRNAQGFSWDRVTEDNWTAIKEILWEIK